MVDYAPGMRTIIRDEEWMVNIIALCRKHHNDVHSGKIDIFKF